MRRKAFLLSSVLLFSGMSGLDAQGVLKESFNTDNFPEVSFVWHEYNPEVLDASEFQSLAENGRKLEFSVQNLPQDIDENQARYVVFLWEDLAYHGINLYEFSKNSLKGFMESVDFGEKDKVNISVYGRREINETSYLRDLTGGFISDETALLSAVDGYQRSSRKYSDFPNRTDIFPAVSEAIEMLRKEGEGVKSVVVLTAGYPLDNSSASSDMNARILSEKYHIPVYFLQYGRDHGYSDKLSTFAPLTYGTFQCFADIDNRKNIKNAGEALESIYSTLAQRYNGQDYLITYTSQARRGDDAKLLEFRINGYDHKEQMLPPARSLGAFIRNHPLLAFLLLITVLGLIALAVVFYVRRRMHDDRRFQRLDEQSRVNQDSAVNAMNAISDTRNAMDRKIQAIRSEQDRDKKADLETILKNKSVYPRLICNLEGEVINFTVTSACTTIGRDASNDLVLADGRVSRRHAKLMFTGYSFEIVDNDSTNGIFLNGEKISGPAVIHDGDKIDLGGVMITVYL